MSPHSTAHQESCSIPCNLCGNTKVSVLASHSRSKQPLRTVICEQCGLVWSDPLPHNPRDFYKDDYRLNYKGTYSPKLKHILRAGNVALSRYHKIEQLLSKPISILDVGSGGGEFSYLLKTIGQNVKCIEPNKGYAEYSAREYGLNVQVGLVQDASFDEGSFDLITIWHVLEHTESPCDVLLKLRALLKPQGILVIEVPNIEATCQSPGSTFHEAHIFNFNVSSLQKMVEKLGLEKIRHFVSSDGGNITMIARKTLGAPPANSNLSIPGNAEKIIRIIRNHTPLMHYATNNPYARLLRRIRQSFVERRNISNFTSGKNLLDQLYSTQIKASHSG